MSDGIVIALISAIASILVVVLQIRSSAQNKEATKKQKQQADDNTEDIKALIEGTTRALEGVKDELQSNNRVTVATARTALKSVYDRLSPKRRLTVTEKSMIEEIYASYKSVTYSDGHHPNSWADAIVNDMRTWEVVPDNYVEKPTTRAKKK